MAVPRVALARGMRGALSASPEAPGSFFGTVVGAVT